MKCLGPSEEAESNDGFSCPFNTNIFVPTSAPMVSPRLSDANTHNCELYEDPTQGTRHDGADEYSLCDLDVVTGFYSEVHAIEYWDDHVNAAALYEADDGRFFPYASFGGDYASSFDATKKKCFDTSLAEEKPNVGAILGPNYYYADDFGRDGNVEFYRVEGILDDEPIFYDDVQFVVSEDHEVAVLGVGVVREITGDTCIDDGIDGGTYLERVAAQLGMLVIRIDTDAGYPESYAVRSPSTGSRTSTAPRPSSTTPRRSPSPTTETPRPCSTSLRSSRPPTTSSTSTTAYRPARTSSAPRTPATQTPSWS